MSETKWQRSDDWAGSQVEDSFVMLDLEEGRYVSLNPTAADIWHMLDAPRSESEIVAALLTKYKVEPDHCLLSVRNQLADMAAKRMAAPVT